MTQEYENVSALVDGELTNENGSKQPFSKKITEDPILSAKWRSYHLTRDLLRNDMSTDFTFDISDKVAKALENELPMVAPKRSWRELPLVASVLPIIRQSGQLAMVASVTALVIFGFQTYNQVEVSDSFATAAPIIGPQGGLAPVSLQTGNNVEQERMNQLLEQRRQLNALIQDHARQQKLLNVATSATDISADNESNENVDIPK